MAQDKKQFDTSATLDQLVFFIREILGVVIECNPDSLPNRVGPQLITQVLASGQKQDIEDVKQLIGTACLDAAKKLDAALGMVYAFHNANVEGNVISEVSEHELKTLREFMTANGIGGVDPKKAN